MATFSSFTFHIFPHYVFFTWYTPAYNLSFSRSHRQRRIGRAVAWCWNFAGIYRVQHIRLMSAGRSTVPPEVQLLSASTAEVTKILLRVNNSQAAQLDYIPSFVLKMCQSAGRCYYWHLNISLPWESASSSVGADLIPTTMIINIRRKSIILQRYTDNDLMLHADKMLNAEVKLEWKKMSENLHVYSNSSSGDHECMCRNKWQFILEFLRYFSRLTDWERQLHLSYPVGTSKPW